MSIVHSYGLGHLLFKFNTPLGIGITGLEEVSHHKKNIQKGILTVYFLVSKKHPIWSACPIISYKFLNSLLFL